MTPARRGKGIRQAFFSRIIAVIGMMTVLMSAVIAVNEWINQKRLLFSRGEQLTRYIATLAVDPLVMHDFLRLDSIVAEGKIDREIIFIAVKDEEGKIVTTRHASLNYSSPVISGTLDQINAIRDFDELLSWLSSREGILVSSPIVTGDHRIGSAEAFLSQQTIRDNIIRTIGAIILGNMAVTMFLAFVLMTVFRRVVFNPLSRLVEAVERMKSGARDVRLEGDRHDEFGLLMRRFNEMVEEIDRTTVSKSHYESVLRSTGEGIVIVSREGVVVDLNPAACRLMGAPRDRIVGAPFSTFIPPIHDESSGADGNDDTPRREVRIRNRAGEEIDLLVSRSPLEESPDGASVLSLVDVSELRQAMRTIETINASLRQEIEQRIIAEEQARILNQDLVRQREELMQANESLESFCYTVSHDLRAPLRHINSFTSIIEEEYGECIREEGREFLRKVIDASARMGVMIDDLLSFSRVARAQLSRRMIDLSALTGEIVAMCRDTDPDRSVDVFIQEGMRVNGDLSMMRLVMQNLVGNAWKYTATRERGRIAVGTTVENGETLFYVRDNGIGFDMAHADKLFHVFERLHGKEYEGSGIGLASVRKIIERHGGRIWGVGVPDGGATFFFTIPL